MAITGQVTLDQIAIYQVDADPTTSGITASIGSFASIYDGVNAKLWLKTGAGDTAWNPIPRVSTAAPLIANQFLFGDANGNIQQTPRALWDAAGRFGFGSNAPAAPQSTIHLDRGNGVGTHIRMTAGTTTGVAATDGTEWGIADDGTAEIRQYENADLRIYTNNILTATFTASGKTLLGTSAVPIDITGASAFPQLQIIGLAAVQMAQIQYSADTIAPVFNSIKSRGATVGTHGLLLADDELGRFQFRGSDGVNFQAGASIRALVDGTAAAGSMPGRLIFMTTPTSTTVPIERMRINANGHVRVVDSFQAYRRVKDYETQVASNSTLVLTSADASFQYFTGTATGQIVRLPDATTLIVGAWYEIKNRNTATTLQVANNGGAVLDTTPAVSGTTIAHLLDNSTSNGTWDVRTRFEPYSDEVSSTAGMSINSATDVLITGMSITPPAGTYRVTFEAPVTNSAAGSTLGFAVYAGGTINTNSNKTFTTLGTLAPGGYYYGTTGTVTVNGAQAIEIRGRRSTGTTTVLVRTMQITRVG